jgi:hypothetical protein
MQAAYRARKAAFDGLFIDRPYDTNGSGSFRWSQVLQRLDRCDPEQVVGSLQAALGC